MNKCIWLARLLGAHPDGLTRDEITAAWAEATMSDRPMARSTFYDNCNYLRDFYGLEVTRSDGRYRLCPSRGGDPTLMHHLFGINTDEDPAEEQMAEYTAVVAEAIGERHLLRMEYASLTQPHYVTDLAPYCLREIRGQRYVVGHSERHAEVRTFSLDRILTLTMLSARFTRPSSFSAEAWFAHSYGAFGGPDLHPEHVILTAATPRLEALLRSRPLHPTQHEEYTPDGLRFILEVALTRDFIGELLSFSDEIRVIAPDKLRRRLHDEAHRLALATE